MCNSSTTYTDSSQNDLFFSEQGWEQSVILNQENMLVDSKMKKKQFLITY